MDKIKANGFWVGVGSAGAVVVALFAAWVLPAWSRQEESRTKITGLATDIETLTRTPVPGFGDNAPGVPGKPDMTVWEKRRDEYLEDYRQIASFYRASDKVLERFFGDQPTITHDQFKGRHTDAANQLEAKLRLRMRVGMPQPDDETKDGVLGFNWVNLEALNLGSLPEASRAAIVRDLQKRFRICEHIATTCLAGGMQIDRLCDVYFFRQIGSPAGGSARPAGENRIAYEELAPDGFLTGGGAGGFQEHLLPENGEKAEAPAGEEGSGDGSPKPAPPKKYLGQTITFGLAVNLPYAEVPRFIAELISCRNSIIVNVIGTRIVVRSQNDLSEERVVKVPEGDKKREDEIVAAETKAVEAKAKPQLVQLQLLCQVVDFDEAALVSKLLQP